MAKSKRALVRMPDAIRIVALQGQHKAVQPRAEDVPVAAATRLTYRNGPLIEAVEVFTIFWGAAWKADPQSGLIARLNAFFDEILTSPLIDQLSEYNAGSHKIAHGRRTGTTTIATGLRGTSVTDTAIQAFLTQQIGKKGVPKVSVNTLYFIYLPPGIRVVMGGSASCQAFCGYHNDIGGKTFYAVMPYPGCTGCTGGLAVFDALTSTSSHELCEAITDPVPGSGWYDDTNGEIGDICAWQTRTIGKYLVQLEWSNKAGACI
ncbi:MAG TPA: hypothetical protein VEL79_05695 [Vicinamibacterales bacterium]|nr:hypothetical protein [Vicinamibacterales bacterium]